MAEKLKFFLGVLFLTGCSFNADYSHIQLEINELVYTAEVVDTPAERAVGLMGRTDLLENAGMWFVFEAMDTHGFWMKNTLIPLDMVWVDDNLMVVYIQRNARPCTVEPCVTYASNQEAKYVLEVAAGTFLGNVGDTFKILNKVR